MGTYPVRYSGGELICIGDEAELRLPDGSTRQVRIGALDSLYNRRAEGWEAAQELPRLHVLDDGPSGNLVWYAVEEPLPRLLNPADLRLLRRSDKLFYNDGREMLIGDLVWENGERELYRFTGIWRRDDPEYAWYFELHDHDDLVLSFEPESGAHGGFTCRYTDDAEGHRSAAMDHLTFVERGPRYPGPLSVES